MTEDYDYVNLDSRDAVVKQREELRETLPQELRKNYDLVVAEADQAAIQLSNVILSPMDPNDKQVLSFYAAQAITHGSHLTHAIDAFLQTVEHNQPPKVFQFFSLSINYILKKKLQIVIKKISAKSENTKNLIIDNYIFF